MVIVFCKDDQRVIEEALADVIAEPETYGKIYYYPGAMPGGGKHLKLNEDLFVSAHGGIGKIGDHFIGGMSLDGIGLWLAVIDLFTNLPARSTNNIYVAACHSADSDGKKTSFIDQLKELIQADAEHAQTEGEADLAGVLSHISIFGIRGEVGMMIPDTDDRVWVRA